MMNQESTNVKKFCYENLKRGTSPKERVMVRDIFEAYLASVRPKRPRMNLIGFGRMMPKKYKRRNIRVGKEQARGIIFYSLN